MVDKQDLTSSVTKDGIFWRNPTHIYEGEKASDQSEIVKAIKGINKKVQKETIRFGEDVRSVVLPGFEHIRDMPKEELQSLCKNLMRYRPNIFKVSIVLGPSYPKENVVKVENREVTELFLDTPQDQTFVGERLGNLLYAKAISIRFEVTGAKRGEFSSECEVYALDNDETYNNDEYFEPVVVIEYYPN
jgi:hypothetical protein